MRILLDLDCVLADFVGAAAKLWGFTFTDLKPFWPAGEYGIVPPLSRRIALEAGRGWSLSESAFWATIEGCPGFWTDIPKLPWADELLDLVRSATDDWWIVTAPSRCPRCIPEKREWVNNLLGVKPGDWLGRHFVPTSHKELMAKPEVLLIDDHEDNCRKFAHEGGYPILFPVWHNRLHHLHDNPMPAVKTALDHTKAYYEHKPNGPAYHGAR